LPPTGTKHQPGKAAKPAPYRRRLRSACHGS
jgi:hypothetical protein